MKTKILSLLITCFIAVNTFSQTDLNAYKYVIVPNKYDFLKAKDQYQLNGLTKFLFEKYGFEALMEGETYPDDLVKNRCLALKSDVLKDSGLFKTKLLIELKDCNDAVVFTTKVGESREKEYGRAYSEALRDAFTDVEALNYNYEPDDNTAVAVTSTETEKEILQLKKELKALKEEKKTQATKTVEHEVAVEKVETEKSMEAEVKAILNSVLYAQEIENGYQLVDATPKVVYKITKTGQPNVFLVNGENAIIYKKDDTWVIEYTTSEGPKQKELNIKF